MALWGYSMFGLLSNVIIQIFFMLKKKSKRFFFLFPAQPLLTDSVMKSWILKARKRETVVPNPTVRDGFSVRSSEWSVLSLRRLRCQTIPSSLQPLSSPTETCCVDCSCALIWQPSRALASCRGSSPAWPSSIRTDTWTAGVPDVEGSKIQRKWCVYSKNHLTTALVSTARL